MASGDTAEMVAAANRALMLSDKCPEAYVLLTYDKSAAEGEPLLRKAVSVAEELVGVETINSPGADLLEVEDGAAYLMARKNLGFCLAVLKDEAGALHHLKAVAALDPQDGMGVGHTLLLSFLVRGEEDDDEHAWQIASAQTCSCPYHLYSRALLSYRRDHYGDHDEESTRLLREALLANPHVPLFLLGVFELPDDPPTAVEVAEDGWLSGETAAGAYAATAITAWEESPGALEWLQISMSTISEELKAQIREEFSEELRAAGLEDIFEDLLKDPFQDSPEENGQDFLRTTETRPRRTQDPAWVFVCRQPEQESAALARYKEALEMVLQESAAEHELRSERSKPLAGFMFFTVIGGTGEVLGMVEGLVDEGVGGFVVCTWCEENESVFEALGVEVVMKETGPPVDLSEFFGD